MWVDIAALAFIAIFAILGYVRGLFSQAWSLGALVTSFFVASPVLEYLQRHMGDGSRDSLLGEWILKLLVGSAIYVGLLAVGYVIERLLVERFKLVSVGNRLLGASLGLAKGGLMVVLALWLMAFFVPTLLPNASDLQHQMATSKVAAAATPYNPINLLLLARVKPYLPVTATGATRPAVKPPKAVEKSESFQKLLADAAFIEAYRAHDYVNIIRNPSFHQFVLDRSLQETLEKSQH